MFGRRRLLHGLAQLTALVVVSIVGGVIVGFALTNLTSDDDAADVVGERRATTDASGASRARAGPTTSARESTAPNPLEQIDVRIISAVLQPAATPPGQRRRRARVSVHVQVENRGTRRVVPARPSLLAARQRVPTDPRADAPKTRLGAIDGRDTVDVTLRFETKGAVTEQLVTQRRGRILVGGRSWPISVTVGRPATSTARSGAGS
ncbi:MAG TPA: hypothetical protein VGV90_09325 [Solirubrobacteraceae bacterium]|nr:hypothetical protein [Solirubrobacteraceae bacterium]